MKDDVVTIYNSKSWMYLSSTKTLPIKLLETWIKFFLIYTPLILVFGAQVGDAAVLRSLCLVLSNFFVVYTFEKIKNAKMFLVVNFIIAAVIYVAYPGPYEGLAYTIFHTAITLSNSSKRNLRVKFLDFGGFIFSGFLFIIYFYCADYIGLTSLKTFVTAAAVNNCICFLIYFHLARRDNLLLWEKGQESKVIKGMKKTSNYFIFAVAAVLAIINILLYKLGIFSMMDSLVMGNSAGKNLGVDNLNLDWMLSGPAPEPINYQMSDGDSLSIFGKIIATLLGIVLAVLAALAAMYILWVVVIRIKELMQRLLSNSSKNDKRESILDEADGKLSLLTNLRRLRRVVEDMTDFSNRKKIRHMYKKIVKRHRKKGTLITGSDTALEIQLKIEKDTEAHYDEVTKMYHKARYAKDECTEADVNIIKKFY